jgi:diamine N-acetyltransferase
VTLCEVTAETVPAVCDLAVADHRDRFVVPNGAAIAQAHLEPPAWFRAICAGREPVGSVMVMDQPDEPYLWRLMIDRCHQGRGHEREALGPVIDRAPRRGARCLLTFCVPGEGSPGGFYHRLGFVDTGDRDGGELVTALDLERTP